MVVWSSVFADFSENSEHANSINMVDKVSPFPAACSRVKKSGKRSTPTDVAKKKNNPNPSDAMIKIFKISCTVGW